jgi:excisionase family DNA binding protein
MAQKFTSLEEAANQLGISKDRLSQLREAGQLRGYRDGASWKFRAEDIQKLAATGIPSIEPEPSDVPLDIAAPKEAAAPAPPSSGLDLDLADEDEALASPPSDLNLEDIDEPTVAADADDEPADVLSLDDDSISLSDSILLSEAEIGPASNRPPSTIIGKAELDLGSDLDLSLSDKDEAGSDMKLAPGSDILSAASGDDLALEIEPPSPSGEFEGLPEVDIDLEAESSRILAPEDLAKAKGAAATAAAATAATSDLELAPTDSDAAKGVSDVGLGTESAVGTGLTGLSALELEDDEDQVLGEGSDVTLSGESSGINIISPSDSGLALDEVALDLAGSSPIGSSLDLGEISEAAESRVEPMALGEEAEKAGEDFQLTPIGEEAEEEDKDSSQVIALDEVAEEEAVGAPIGTGDSRILAEDFGAVGLVPGAVTVIDAAETTFSTANIVLLGCCMFLLAVCGMLIYDLLCNMWIWEGVSKPLNSWLLEALNPFIK